MSDGMQWIVRFELPNGGPGPETVASEDVAAEFDGIVVLLLRDHYCQVSRDRANAYSDAFDAFREEDVAVVAALPDDVDRAAYWRTRYDLDFPVVADAADGPTVDATDSSTAEATDGPTADADAEGAAPAMTDGTPRFDAFSDVETGVDTLPAIGVLDASSNWPRLVRCEGGETLQECPDPDQALAIATDALD